MITGRIERALPDWIDGEVDADRLYADSEERVALAIRLARCNVAHASGGPC
ncbi:MAG: hypothetical protein WBV61_03970 [Rhodanobacteraceae bacterium]